MLRGLGETGFGPKVRYWNRTDIVERWRERWAELANERLAELDIDARVLVRPSGTESKVKCYFEVVVDHEQRDQAAEQLALLRTALAEATGTMPA